jgi:hypothetical protein
VRPWPDDAGGTLPRNLGQHKKIFLGMPAAICSVQFASMTASTQTALRQAGSHFTMGCQQQRCGSVRPVVISVWNKKTGTGYQN